MGYLKAVRQQIENLILGSVGTGHTIASGRFHLLSDDAVTSANTAERRVNVMIGPRGPLPGTYPNQLDGFGLYQHPVSIVVEYARTTAGGDLVEAIGQAEQQGPATDDAIDDRIALDQHDIEQCVGWYANWSGFDPSVIKLVPSEQAPTVKRTGDIVSVTLAYTLWVQATIPGSYAP